MALPGGAGGRDASLRSARCARSLYAAGSAPPARAVVAEAGKGLPAVARYFFPPATSFRPLLLSARYFFSASAGPRRTRVSPGWGVGGREVVAGVSRPSGSMTNRMSAGGGVWAVAGAVVMRAPAWWRSVTFWRGRVGAKTVSPLLKGARTPWVGWLGARR